MRLLSRLDDARKSGAIWYAIFRQSPKSKDFLVSRFRRNDVVDLISSVSSRMGMCCHFRWL